MHWNKVVTTKMNYGKLAEGIRGPVAITTAVAVVRFKPSDPFKTTAMQKCRNFRIQELNDQIGCAVSEPMSESERNVKNGLVYAYNTNISDQALFVLNHKTP
ncbi:hypothetical protein MRX96_057790 [Rhipicephalus microplus]